MLSISKVSSLCALFIVILCQAETSRVIDLSGEWKFISRNKSISGTGKIAKILIASTISGRVPGDIYTDLFNNNIIDKPLYGDNHRFTNWVARDDWTYTKQFKFDPKLLEVIFRLQSVQILMTFRSRPFFSKKRILLTLCGKIKSM